MRSFSEVLKGLGFDRSGNRDLSITESPAKEDRGKFYWGDFVGMRNTVAVDEDGYLWVKDGHIDLSLRGFKRIFPPIH